MNNSISSYLIDWQLSYPSDLDKQLQLLYEEMINWNKRMNLTRITDKEAVYQEHFLDSIIPLKFISPAKNATVLDIGTGAGFPGIPVKLVRPDLDITLMDSEQKKVNYLQSIKRKLDLDNLHPLHERAEHIGQDKNYRDSYSVVVTRAVSSMNILCELSLPLISEDGLVLMWKTKSQYQDELKRTHTALETLNAQIEQVYEYQISAKDQVYCLVGVRKYAPCPDKYPRRPGILQKRPL